VRTLFLRIFLSFWAAMLLVLSSTAAVAWYRFNQVQSVTIRQLADEAAARLYAGGPVALRAWIPEAQHKYPGRPIYIVDQTGEDILGRTLPSPLGRYAKRLKDAGFLGEDVLPSRKEDPLLLTPLFTDRDGVVYTIMINTSGWPLSLLLERDVRLLVLAFALVISGVLCWWLARYVSKPVVRLQSSARSLAAGNLDARVGEDFSRRRDELGVLARDFDTMALHVRNLIASKESLLRGMSHELRSPLARLRVALGLARRDGADLTRQLDRIELEAERLDVLIGQMLQLSQLRAVEPTLPHAPVDLTALLNEVVEDARLEATAANKFVAWVPGDTVSIEADHNLMRSAIENVLRNAVRFTTVGTAVVVSLTHDNANVSVLIEDRGPGVPKAELQRIFEPFYRVAESRDRDSGGTGLGLAITGRIVPMYGGEVTADNREGGGLSVTIRLPLLQSGEIEPRRDVPPMFRRHEA
jgi:two-component system sensor histidine kinase CpxA